MNISVVDPVTPAIERTKQMLFQPFDLGKWLTLGFCAFLMQLGQGGGFSGSGGPPGGGGGQGGGPDIEPIVDWLRENFLLIAAIVGAILLLGLLFGLLLTWLSSRGQFMFLDGVVRDRGAVTEPWREYRREANSLFGFRICLGLVGLLYVILVLGACGLIAWPTLQEGPGPRLLVAVLLAILLFLPFALVMSFIGTLLDDFIVPIMYLRRIRSLEAWRVFRDGLWTGNALKFVLFFLFKILLGIGVGVISMMIILLTCCIAALPYVSSVALLPLTVFIRCYSLYFLQQFGGEWDVFLPHKPQSPFAKEPAGG